MKQFTSMPQRVGSLRAVHVCLLAGAALALPQARADDINWSNINGGTFSVGTNWIGGAVPGAGDTARFGRTRDADRPLAYTVSFTTNPSNLGIVIQDDHVAFDLNGHAHLLTSASTAITVGTTQGGTGQLTIFDGAMATTAAAPNAFIGTNGVPGLLNISTGGQLLGPLLWVGAGGPGTLILQNGGDFVGKDMLIGGLAGGNGAAIVTGANSVALVDGGLAVGALSSGSLNISAGGRVESNTGVLGQVAAVSGTVNVDGPNSRWIVSDEVIVGHSGQGTMNITGGGLLQSELASGGLMEGTIGLNTGSTGTVAVAGLGSVWNGNLQFTVGGRGNASMSITDGGVVACAYANIARHAGISSVSVSGPGATWTVFQGIAIGGGFNPGINGGSGSLLVGPGGTVSANFVDICPNDVLDLNGGTLDVFRMDLRFDSTGQFLFRSGVLNARFIHFNVLNQGGILAPGRFVNTNITGSYTQQAGARLKVDIAGTDPLDIDQLLVTGVAALGGTLDLRLINGFVPTPDQTMVVLDASSITGAFSNAFPGHRVLVQMTGTDGTAVVHYGPGSPFDPTQVVLSDFIRPCPADFNLDNSVDFFDYDDFVTCFEGGACPPGVTADFNEDGSIDFFDYDDFVISFETTC